MASLFRTLQPPRCLEGKYRLEALIARGPVASVYRASRLRDGHRVAVKLLEQDMAGNHAAERLERELQLLCMLEHPHILEPIDGSVAGPYPYLVTEWLDGETLAACIRRESRLHPSRVLAVCLPILGALAYAHGHGVVHRDVKPSNILLVQRRDRLVPTLIDFGIATVAHAPAVTATGRTSGTPAYMAPEQLTRELPAGPAADVWSLGVVLYECLSGRLPYTAKKPTQMVLRIVAELAEPLGHAAPRLPRPFAAAVDRALSRDPRQRYADMGAFAHGLLQAAMASGIPVPDDPEPVGLPHWSLWVAQARLLEATRD